MRQILVENSAIAIQEMSRQQLGAHELLVAIEYAFISSQTDIQSITRRSADVFSNVPRKIKEVLRAAPSSTSQEKAVHHSYSIGYSCSGRVIAVGKGVRSVRPGDLVAVSGVNTVTLYADLIRVSEKMVAKVRHEKHVRAASLAAVGSMAVWGVRRAQLQLGETVCIIGLGLLGQCTVQLAKMAGCRVFGVDLLSDRLAIAGKGGADELFYTNDERFLDDIALLTEGHGVDTVIMTASSSDQALMQRAAHIVRKRGRIVLLGEVGVHLTEDAYTRKEFDLIMVCPYGPGALEEQVEGGGHSYEHVRWTHQRNLQMFVSLIEEDKLNTDLLISEQVSVEQLEQMYGKIQRKELLAVLLEYPTQRIYQATIAGLLSDLPEENLIKRTKRIQFTPSLHQTIRVGVVGEAASQQELVSLVATLRHVKVAAIAEETVVPSRIAEGQGAYKTGISIQELLQEDAVDAVLIASAHKQHMADTIEVLEHGKAVFLEKPIAVDRAQFEQIRSFLQQYPHAPLCVDYSYSSAPFVRKIKEHLVRRTTPLMIHHRMNVPTLYRQKYWQTDVGAGRIIGSASQAIDLFCFLTDAKPISLSVEALYVSRDDIFPTDNFTAHISFDDGSVCSLVHTSLGHLELGSDRVELFFDRKSIVLDDFMGLYGFGVSSRFNEHVSDPDRGRAVLIKQFFEALRQPAYKGVMDIDRLCMVTQLAITIDELVCKGGGSMMVTDADQS